jgi:hypothetical protein
VVWGNYVARCLRGIDCNQGENNVLIGNVVDSCLDDGIQAGVQGARNNKVWHNTIIGRGALQVGYGINLGTAASAANQALNNIITGYATGVLGSASSSENYNCINAATPRSGGIGAGAQTISADPQLDRTFRPQNAAVRAAGAFIGSSDFYGNAVASPPDIGAVQYIAARSLDAARDVTVKRGVG